MDFALIDLQIVTSPAGEQNDYTVELSDAHLAMVGGGIGDVVPA